jgi:uridine kinase
MTSRDAIILPFADGPAFLTTKLREIGASPARRRLVAVAGPSQCGKSFFTETCDRAFRQAGLRCVHLSMDDYYRTKDELTAANGDVDFDTPAAVDLQSLAEDLGHLVHGVVVPHRTLEFHEEPDGLSSTRRLRKGTDDPSGVSVVVVEGLFVHHPPVRALADVLVMVRHVSDERRLELRLQRDVTERGFDQEVARERWWRYVEPGTRTHVLPPDFERTFQPDVVLVNSY